ncbi:MULTISPECIES: TerB N-terminal domain-containing protein [Pseudomonas]|uniref:tellurite resistance TerB family protein n=1 Tax=Pseudomonas TaxID=286 RepID=UPI0005A9D3C6|nr:MULTISPECIES: TerB N-terminal domain-containing protein [Pseudomonas]AZD36916.1 putative membrane protein [Pseudomonas chlororaphis subsp. aurantiaca]AZD43255.1 putative membrane protein [Pseudomonas chlororaphis subsp. aurantiaca]AZD49498.1 putative membrane protein [Pseudomonas chlororaphis subsp. aurantiaca]AZD93690.1 putative membrane protein [Pseudomonas chlororaphis subsp. aureofaciens]AZD99995.1 putative membrane protein [Pseudomonas chlororaphis subsp. aureofaciens]
MARKKAKNSGGAGILIMFALAFSAVAAIPKNAWIAIGVIACIGAILWILAVRAQRQRDQVAASTVNRTRMQEPQRTELKFSLHEILTSGEASEADREFYTVQLGSRPSTSFKIPDAGSQKSDARWVPAGESVIVAGFSLPGGMFYIGSTLGGRYETQEPSLINPKLRIAKTYVDIEERLMSYWPSFHSITPEARRGYLQWLEGGRSDPLADTGYVFLFFYGLERRALVDTVNDPEVKAEMPLIVEEIKRLLSIYGENRSFKGYAEGFLDYLSNTTIDPNFYLGSPPEVAAYTYEMPLPLRIGLGQHAANKRPLDADWALAWALADPNIGKRTPVTRCKEVFATLFKLKYASFHPAGLTLAQNKTKLKTSYRPASAVLKAPSLDLGDIPDVMATSGTRKNLQLLVELCTSELEPYSRYLGRNPESAEALEGLLQLPVTLWPTAARTELDELQSKIGEDLIVMSFGELAGRFKSADALSRDKVLALARALESLHIGMEPDVLAGSRTPKAEDRIALFVTQPEDGSLRASAAYNAASVTLDLASAVASADGDTSNEEVTLLAQHIDSWSHLSVAHRKRLKAHLQIQLQQPPTLASLKKKLDPLTVEAKRTIASFLAHLAQADGTVSPSEVKLLERVYKALQLDSQLLYSDLHGAAAGTSIALVKPITGSSPSEPGTQTSATAKQGVVLDHERIAQLQRETAEVSALLAQVFTDDQIEEPEQPVENAESAPESSADVAGLDLEHSAFLRLLVSRPEWSRSELEAAASDMELMLDGALEQINDMAFERFDMPVTEGDDPVEINTDILEELAL